MKRKILILEGADKTGKSTLKKALARATNFEVLIYDRSLGSHYVYSKFYRRDEEADDFLNLENDIFCRLNNIEVYLIVVTCSEFIFWSRNIVDSDDLIDEASKNFVECDRLFRKEYFKKTALKKKMILDTDLILEDAVSKILEFIGE